MDSTETTVSDWQAKILQDAIGRPIGIRTLRSLIQQTGRHAFSKTGLLKYRVCHIMILICGMVSLTIHLMDVYETTIITLFLVVLYAYIAYIESRLIWKRKLSAVLCEVSVRPKACLICDYDLYGSVSKQCPECGEPLANPSDIDNDAPLVELFESNPDQS
ncbi:MAG: hypothetical protein KTR15_01785 [Phycisphaeraceae bacterium]|nr:hypothetical protein [Phycisphaeraceae bacterium]